MNGAIQKLQRELKEFRSVAEAVEAEIKRVRDEVMPEYILIGDSGRIALTMMRADMDHAIKALYCANATECIRLLNSLKGYR